MYLSERRSNWQIGRNGLQRPLNWTGRGSFKLIRSCQLRAAEHAVKFGCLKACFQASQFTFEWDSFKQGDVIHEHSISHSIVQKSSVTIIMRTAKQDLMAMDIMKIQLEDFFVDIYQLGKTQQRLRREDQPVILSSALSLPVPTSIKSNKSLLPLNPLAKSSNNTALSIMLDF